MPNFVMYNISMTVGELVHKQALEAGYSPAFASTLISPANDAFKALRELSGTLEKPMKMAAEAFKHIQPQLKVIEEMNLPEKLKYLQEPIVGITLSEIATQRSSLIPNSFYNEDNELLIPQFTNPVQEVRIVNVDEITGAKTNRKKEYLVGSYHLPQNAVWESLEIQFIDGHFVKVSYTGMQSKKFDYKDMGFINMKTLKPDLKWQLLLTIAENGGTLTNAKWDRKFGRNVKYELNEGLKRFFNMTSNPIPHYTKRRGYQSLFTLRSDK